MRSFLVAFAMLLAGPVSAAETPWQQLAPDVRLRLISSDTAKPDGTTTVALELDMPLTYKTYWRVPGETGIPTQVDLAGSTGIGTHTMLWPYPEIETADGYVDFVYRGPTVLPVDLSLDGAPATLRAAITMGICSDVCVPARAQFELPLTFARPDRGQGLRIAQAVAATPVAWSGPQDAIGSVTFDVAANALAVAQLAAEIDPLSLIADASASGQLFGAPQKSPDGKLVLLPLLGRSGATGIAGALVDLTFMTAMGPFSVTRRIAHGSTATGE